jgi:hypothetical protein
MSRLSYFLGLMAFLHMSFVSNVKGQNEDILCLPCVREFVKSYDGCGGIDLKVNKSKGVIYESYACIGVITLPVLVYFDYLNCDDYQGDCSECNFNVIFSGKSTDLPNCNTSPPITIPTFTDVTPPSFNTIKACDAQIGDVDNDGDMDIIMDQNLVRNNNGTFSLATYVNGSDIDRGSLLDINRDGNLDYVKDYSELVDFDNNGRVSLMNGIEACNACFCPFYDCLIKDLESNICILPNTNFNSILSTDIDNDNIFDLIRDNNIYTNVQTSFNRIGTLPFNILISKAFDLNNDGKVDIINGYEDIQIMINNGNIITLEKDMNITQIHIADINNDGYQDVLSDGIYFQNGEQMTFTFFNSLPGISIESNIIKPIDYDKDGDMDLLVIRYEGSPKLFRNNGTLKNIKPNRPNNPVVSVSGTNVNFSWSNGGDDLTQFPTYNLYIKNLTTNEVLYFPHADTVSGSLRKLEKGNCEYNTGWKLKNLKPGRYRWKVQAIDQGFLGSDWTVGQNFIIESSGCNTEIEMVQGVTCILPKVVSTGEILYPCRYFNGASELPNQIGFKTRISYEPNPELNVCISTCQQGTKVLVGCVENSGGGTNCNFGNINIIHTTCGINNGAITLSNINGCTYRWPDGSETNARSNLSAGEYKITLIPVMIDTVIKINTSSGLNVGNPNITQPSCGLANGNIELPQGSNLTYRWQDGITTRVRNNLPGGAYQVTISDGVCIDTRSISLSVSSGLNATYTNNRQPTCGQSNGKVTLNTGAGNHSYIWNDPSISGAAPQNLKANTDYKVTITRISDVCKDTLSLSLTDYNPSVVMQPSRSIIDCNNDTPVQLSVISQIKDLYNNTYTVSNYVWSDPTISGTTSTVMPAQSSIYMVTITDSNGCTSSAQTSINVNKEKPVGSISSADGTVITCAKKNLQLKASSNVPNASYRWIQGITGSNAQVSINNPATYIVEVRNTNNGCKDTVSVNISIDTIVPSFTKKYRGEVNCFFDKDTLIINHLTGSYSYAWSSNLSNNNNAIVTSGTYGITVTDGKNKCTKEDAFIVKNNINFPSVKDFEDILTCEHDTAYVEIKTQDGRNIELSLDGAPFSKSGFITTEPITLKIVHQDMDNGCKSESNVTVTVDTTQIAGAVCGDGMFIQSDCECRLGCSQIKMKDDHIINPNMISTGSYLSIPLANVSPENKLIIVNRWGQVVYKKSPYISTIDEGWRGTYMDTDNPLPDGAYYYQLILIPNDKTCRFAGSVTVVR